MLFFFRLGLVSSETLSNKADNLLKKAENFDKTKGPIPFVMNNELFGSNARSKANGIAVTIHWLSNFLISLAIPVLVVVFQFFIPRISDRQNLFLINRRFRFTVQFSPYLLPQLYCLRSTFTFKYRKRRTKHWIIYYPFTTEKLRNFSIPFSFIIIFIHAFY
jgi:hypothetical protein